MRSRIFEWYPKIFEIDKEFKGNQKIERLRNLESDMLESISVPDALHTQRKTAKDRILQFTE